MNNFSVLMSVYNLERPEYLSQSLDSVFQQTLKPAEVILMQDGPLTQELYQTINEYTSQYPELKTFVIEKNGGLGAALNEGIKHCSHELVVRMDTDDICKPHRFETQITFMNEHPDIDIISSWIDEFESDISNINTQRRIPEFHDEIIKYARHRCPVNHPTVVYRKSRVIAAGGYQSFPEDYYLWVKMIMTGCRFHNIQESLLYFRFSPEVYKRRGGWKYAKFDLRAHYNFYKMGFLSTFDFIYNTSIRCVVRLIPSTIRSFIYKRLIRRV